MHRQNRCPAQLLFLLRRQFLSLVFAFVTEQFQRAFSFFVRGRDLLLHLGCSLFHLLREPDVAVVLHSGACGDETAHDDVFLQATQVIDGALDGGFREHARGFLERRRRDERIGGERGLGDAEQQRTAGGRFAAIGDRLLVLFAETELVDLLFQQERGIAHVFHFHPAHHLANDHFDVLVADVDTLQAVNFLDFIHQVGLQFLLAQHGKNVVRVERAVHQRLASADALAFLHIDVDPTRHLVLFLGAVVGHHVDLALAFGHVAKLHHAIDLADDRGFARLAGFEQFDHARQTARDVLGLGGFARDLRQHIARSHRLAILHHQVSAGRHQVAFAALASLNDHGRLPLLIRRVNHDMARQTRDLVHFFMQGHAFLQVLELHGPANFGQDGEGVRVPLDQDIAQADRLTVLHLDLGAVNHGVALFFAALVVQDGDGAVAVHHHQVAFLGAHGHQVDESHTAVSFGIEARLFADSRSRTADVEGTHGELGPRLADGLRRDNARGLAQLDQPAGSQVAPVTHHAHAPPRFAGEHGADLDPLDTGRLHRTGQVFGDLLVDVNDDVAFVVLDFLQRDAAHDTVAQRLDDLARLHDGGDVDAIDRTAIVFADDHVLRHVHQAPGQVARVRRLESGIGQSLTGAVGGDEVLQHGQAFAEVRRDRGLDDFARRLGHQATHAGELTNLLLGAASAGVSHDVNGIDVADFVVLLHGGEHLVGNFFRDGRPDFDDFVVALAVGDGAVQILLLHRDRLLFGVAHQARFARRNHHVVDPNREARHGGVVETELLDAVQHPHRGFQTEAQVAIVHQVAHALLLEQAVDVGHLRSTALQVVVHDGAAHGGRDELPLKVGGIGMDHVLIVIRDGEIDHLTRVAQANRGQRFHFARFLRENHFINVGECASLTLCARLGLGQVVNAQHHVLRGHGDRLSRRRRQDVVRGQHQHAGFHLRFRRQRNVHCHLIAVEIGVECGADQRVNLDGLAFHQHRLKSLNAEAVKGGRAIQQDRVVLNHFFQDVPYDGLLLLHHFLGLLDGGAVSGLLQTVIDERLEQLQRHFLGQAALVQLEVGTHHNDGAAGIVHALAQQVLAEAALLALQRVGQRLERTVVGATQHAATASIVEQRVHGLLQHALLVAHDDFRRMQIHQLLQAVVAVSY